MLKEKVLIGYIFSPIFIITCFLLSCSTNSESLEKEKESASFSERKLQQFISEEDKINNSIKKCHLKLSTISHSINFRDYDLKKMKELKIYLVRLRSYSQNYFADNTNNSASRKKARNVFLAVDRKISIVELIIDSVEQYEKSKSSGGDTAYTIRLNNIFLTDERIKVLFEPINTL